MDLEQLQGIGKTHGYTVDTFITTANWSYDAVLWVGIGRKYSDIPTRNSHRVLWYCSYDSDAPSDKALQDVHEYILQHPTPPTGEELDADIKEERRIQRNELQRKRRAKKKVFLQQFKAEQGEIENSPQLTPIEAEKQDLISLQTFSGSDRETLINEKSIRLWNNVPMIFEGRMGKHPQWQRFSEQINSYCGCLNHPDN